MAVVVRRLAVAAVVVLVAAPALAQNSESPPVDQSTGATTTTTGYSGHGSGSVSPETLARFAAPPIGDGTRAAVQRMLDVRAPGRGVPTNDGERLFFGWNVTGVAQVWRLDEPGGFPVQMTGGEDPTSVVAVTPDGGHIVVSRDKGGSETPGLYLQPADGGALRPVFAADGVRASLSFVSDDGARIYYTANDQRPDTYSIYRFDVADGSREPVFEPDSGVWWIADRRGGPGDGPAPDGRLLLGKATGALTSEYWELDPATGSLIPVLGQDAPEEYRAAYGPGDGELLVLTPKLGEFRRLYRLRYEGGGTADRGDTAAPFVPATPELDHDVDSFDMDRQGRRILYTVNEGGYTRLFALDATSGRPVRLPGLPDDADHVYAGGTTRKGRYTTISVETSRSPAAAYVLDWSKERLVRWHSPSTPEVDTSRFAVASLEHYPARDGTQIPMFVRRPGHCAGASVPCPVVVNFHGGPESQSVPGFSLLSQMFVDAGFVYVHPNVRGSDGYGKTWLHADDGPKRLDVITDIEDAATWIRANWGVDGTAPKVGVYGGSYGGYSALMGMTRFAGAYDAGVSVVGMSNLVTFLENTAPYRRALRISEYGDPEKDRDALVALSPSTYVDQVRDPLLVIQGANDPRVPVGEAVQIHEQLKSRGIDAPLIIFADEGHGTAKRDNQVLQYGHILEFFTRHLQ